MMVQMFKEYLLNNSITTIRTIIFVPRNVYRERKRERQKDNV